ncbi:glycerophosphocholine phosphodiesterase GPCPD1 [Teleopsis dalmanni]|uniref:glycerophosphocholine phosphodiesterase GPCPD1 n=1 Tax=Teleopsis dalmanni TaxID=139649 RepID=UPI0018CD544B|nr:glycerophosphocholine phosphodiesterase GPCPD1 [Teleopsis dalmanni]
MSVPVLLTVLDSNAAATQAATPAATPTSNLLLDDHNKSCASYVDTTALTPTNLISSNLDDTVALKSCVPTLRKFAVKMDRQLRDNERVGLTGNSKALGQWQLERCVTLSTEDNVHWNATVLLQSCQNVNYRYFVYVKDTQGRKHIRYWETQFEPRKLQTNNTNVNQVDRFGEMSNEKPQINRGWLTNDSIVQFKFERETLFQVKDINKFDPDNVLIRIVPLQADMETALEESLETGLNIEVAKLKYGESRLQPQQTFGIPYERGDTIIFHIHVPYAHEKAFALVFHNSEKEPIGKALITPSSLAGSEGVLELNITEANPQAENIIAHLTLPYLIVNPFTDTALDFRTTYAHFWPKTWPNLDVGHRGNGRSYIASPPDERENTIASFMRSYESFADMVELDVHLTADGVPIIYHDFGVKTAPLGKKITSKDQLQFVLIKDITYEALKQLRVFAVINNEPKEFPAHNVEPRADHRIFPTLAEVLEALPKPLGIDVEIKWPQRTAGGGVEAKQTIDKNFFVDRVLNTVITLGCGRPLLFSSFDADICTMLRFKQNLFPVLFLSIGKTSKWSSYMDLRTRSFEQAINNAQAFELAGTAPHAEDFLEENGAELMQKAILLEQITLVWGDDCNSNERVKYFRDIGATAICYDRTDLYVPKTKTTAFFNSTSLMNVFEERCMRQN